MNNLPEDQRQTALQSIELLRALSPRFLDGAGKILKDGNEEGLRGVINNGCRVSTALTRICEALWALENAGFEQRIAEITGKGGEADA